MAPKIKLISIERPCENPSCGRSFATKTNPDGSPAKGYPGRFCSRQCARVTDGPERHRRLEAEWLASEDSLCPCGGRIPYERRIYKHCSLECAKVHGKKRQANPDNWVTITCETCDQQVDRRKNYGGQGRPPRFCSNACAAKWTRKVRHIGIKDSDVVLDSGWEALVWGLCSFRKVPIARFDRARAIPCGDGWYGPDFVIAGHHVEVKGLEDDDDRGRYDAWRATGGDLVVLDKDRLELLLTGDVVDLLDSWRG